MPPLHNVIFFHNYCTIDSTTIFPAFHQHIHTVLFTITLPSPLTLLFIEASFTQCDIFSQLLIIDSATMSTAFPQHIHTVMFTITLPSTLALLFIYAFLFTMWYSSTITSQLTLQQYFQHILNIYIRYCLQLHYPVYWLCCLYMLPLHNVNIVHPLLHNWLYNNYYSISSTYTYGTVYNYTTQYTNFAFTYAILCTIWYFPTITAQLTLQQCLQHILNIYI